MLLDDPITGHAINTSDSDLLSASLSLTTSRQLMVRLDQRQYGRQFLRRSNASIPPEAHRQHRCTQTVLRPHGQPQDLNSQRLVAGKNGLSGAFDSRERAVSLRGASCGTPRERAIHSQIWPRVTSNRNVKLQ
ncbi:MAG: hypothetical protein ACLTHL_03030 [Collinsella sp.]